MPETTNEDLKPRRPSEDAAKNLRTASIRGGLWVLALSILAIPLSYVRTWLLGQVGEDGFVLGTYAVVMIFFNLVTTFAIPGGASVMTGLLPKQETNIAKANLAASYAVLSIASAGILLGSIFFVPQLNYLVFANFDGHAHRFLFLALGFAIVSSQLAIYILSGLMHFRLVAVLSQLQLVMVSTIAAIAVFLYPEVLQRNAILALVMTIGLAQFLIALVGGLSIVQALPRPQSLFSFPNGFWRFSLFVHINTLATFAYTNIDQLILATWIGTRELGAYFALLQIAMLITFIPMRIGQVMLSSFSSLVRNGDYEDLSRAYQKLCRLMLLMSTPLTLFLVLFSSPIAAIFGPWLAEKHYYLPFLAGAIYVGCLGSINSMLILSQERTGMFFINNVTLIVVQLIASFALISDHGVFGIISGKALAIVCGQIGLFAIVRFGLSHMRISPPREYFIGIAVVLVGIILSWAIDLSQYHLRLVAVVCLTLAFTVVARVRLLDFYRWRTFRW